VLPNGGYARGVCTSVLSVNLGCLTIQDMGIVKKIWSERIQPSLHNSITNN
jgi:hypothetical protein